MDSNFIVEYKEILNGIVDGVFILNENLCFTFWNKSAEIGTSLKSDEVLEKNVFEIFPNAKNSEIGEKYILSLQTQTFQNLISKYKDEKFEATFDIRIFPIEKGLVVFFRDITEEKEKEEQNKIMLQISKTINTSHTIEEMCFGVQKIVAKYFEVPINFVSIFNFDMSNRFLHLVSNIENKNSEIENSILHQNFLGNSYIQKVAQNLNLIFTDEIIDGTFAKIFFSELEILNLKTLIALPLLIQNELEGVIEIIMKKNINYIEKDIKFLKKIANELANGLNRKKLLEKILHQKTKLEEETKKTEEANAQLKKFIAMFSHDLRAPLSSIISFADLLSKNFSSFENEKIQNFMSSIVESGNHLQNLINDILDLSKIEAGVLKIHIENFAISYLKNSLEKILQNKLQEKNIQLEFDIANDLDIINADQTRIQQILVNLISNSIKFSNDGGKIIIGFLRNENDIKIFVKDFGKGIPQSEIPKLFKPFYQVKSSGKEGTGLGLAITKKLVELHNGKISIESEENNFTKFLIQIPLTVNSIETIADEKNIKEIVNNFLEKFNEKLPIQKRKPLALIADDSIESQKILAHYLKGENFETVYAKNGIDAFEKAKEFLPDIILLDIMLPIKDGWQVLKLLKQHPVCKNIPVIIVSVSDEKTLGTTLGADDYFVKPVNRDEFLNSVKHSILKSDELNNEQKILIIDDDKNFSELIDVMLSNEGFTIIKSLTGSGGIKKAEEEIPNLIILDLMLSDGFGLDFAEKLKENSLTKDIPIIIISSAELDDEMEEKIESLAKRFVSKSKFTKQDLLKSISL